MKSNSPARPINIQVKTPPKPANKDLVIVKNLQKQFELRSGPVTVLQDVNFRVPQNSLAIIFGPSGSGKSTLLNILSGLETPTQGSVIVDGQDLYGLDIDQRAHFRARIMGIVNQENYWIKSLNVLENVAMPLYLTGSPKSSALIVARDSLAKVGMADYAHYLPAVLSGGQQQRVSMARALVASPQLILADEPTGNLDSKNGQMIIDLLLYFQQKLNRTIILVTHNIEYLPLSDTQLFMRDGRITESRAGQKLPIEITDTLKTQIADLTKIESSS
jgi:ABC-type lipoprotein export system ATPase subunit